MSDPQFCRPEAFRLMQDQLPVLETVPGLVRGAMAIALHALDDSNVSAEVEAVERQLSDLARRVRERVRGDSFDALLAHLHDVLFEEDGFRGNGESYYLPSNSYLPVVLQSRLGIPISLCLIYRAVADKVGLVAEGVNCPGHFLVRVRGPRGWQTIDPYHGGAVLEATEVRQRLAAMPGVENAPLDQLLPAATHREWLLRMVRNLKQILAAERREDDLAAMGELEQLLFAAPA